METGRYGSRRGRWNNTLGIQFDPDGKVQDDRRLHGGVGLGSHAPTAQGWLCVSIGRHLGDDWHIGGLDLSSFQRRLVFLI